MKNKKNTQIHPDRTVGRNSHHRNTFTLKKLIFSAVFCHLSTRALS